MFDKRNYLSTKKKRIFKKSLAVINVNNGAASRKRQISGYEFIKKDNR